MRSGRSYLPNTPIFTLRTITQFFFTFLNHRFPLLIKFFDQVLYVFVRRHFVSVTVFQISPYAIPTFSKREKICVLNSIKISRFLLNLISLIHSVTRNSTHPNLFDIYNSISISFRFSCYKQPLTEPITIVLCCNMLREYKH